MIQENELTELGFMKVKSYLHDSFSTRRFEKGLLTIEITVDTVTKEETCDTAINDEILDLSLSEIKQLDSILNKNYRTVSGKYQRCIQSNWRPFTIQVDKKVTELKDVFRHVCAYLAIVDQVDHIHNIDIQDYEV